jgi:hypothetical protein
MRNLIACLIFTAPALTTSAAASSDAPTVTARRAPLDGLQPRAAVDPSGAVHVVVFRGPVEQGDLYYVRSNDGAENFGEALRITTDESRTRASRPASCAQLALGRGGRVHVAWNGLPGANSPAAMHYSRLAEQGSAFEAPRNVIGDHYGIEGGGAIAADGDGRVWVAWHAPATPDGGEAGRTVFAVQSGDDGQSFAAERPISLDGTGVGACCNVVVLPYGDGALGVLYRGARRGKFGDRVFDVRDSIFYYKGPAGSGYSALDDWEAPACAPTSYSSAASPSGPIVAYETNGAVHWLRPSSTMEGTTSFTPPGESSARRSPSVAINAKGEVLLAWIAAPDSPSGSTANASTSGVLEWCVFAADGAPLENSSGRLEGAPASTVPAAVALASGKFVLFY